MSTKAGRRPGPGPGVTHWRVLGLVAGTWLALLATATPAVAADNGLTVLAVPAASGGVARVQVEADAALADSLRQDGATPSRFRAVLDQGGGSVTAVRRMADETQDGYTVLAFDQSGSFATYWPRALELATAYVTALQGRPRHTVSVMSFGMSRTTHCTEPVPGSLEDCLKKLAPLGAKQQVTRLKFYVQEAVREASDRLPLARQGSREVIVFTDAGDESDALSVKDVAREARELGVRVHVVCFTRTARGKKLAQRLDEMKLLAEGSGGHYLQVEDSKDPARDMAGLAQALDRVYWLDVALCGVKPSQSYDQVAVEALTGGQRTQWSDRVSFRVSADGDATKPCQPVAPAPPPPTPEAPQPQAVPPPATPSWWWLLLIGGGLAIAGTLVGLLARRRSAPPPAPVVTAPPAPAPLPAPPPQVVTPPAPAQPVIPAAPTPAPWKDPFATLPETRLVVRQGPPGLEPYYRVHKAEFTIGARAGEMDLVIDHPAISGHHATVHLFKTGNVFVIDQRSTNGTWVDGRRLDPGQRVQLLPGQSLRLSQHVELVLAQPEAARPAEPPAQSAPAPTAAPAAPPQPVEPPARSKSKTIYAPAREDEE